MFPLCKWPGRGILGNINALVNFACPDSGLRTPELRVSENYPFLSWFKLPIFTDSKNFPKRWLHLLPFFVGLTFKSHLTGEGKNTDIKLVDFLSVQSNGNDFLKNRNLIMFQYFLVLISHWYMGVTKNRNFYGGILLVSSKRAIKKKI